MADVERDCGATLEAELIMVDRIAVAVGREVKGVVVVAEGEDRVGAVARRDTHEP